MVRSANVWKRKDGKSAQQRMCFDSVTEYIELRVKLTEGLKARRVQKGLTQIQLAKAVQSSQSRVARMEAGDPTVTLDLLVRSLLALGASNTELARIIARR